MRKGSNSLSSQSTIFGLPLSSSSSSGSGDYQAICRQVLAMDGGIRFAGIADGYGMVIEAQYREGLAPLLTPQESSLSMVQATIKMLMNKGLEKKLGPLVYSYTLYGKVKRASIPIGEDHFFMLSFDLTVADHEKLIVDRIIPFLKESLSAAGAPPHSSPA